MVPVATNRSKISLPRQSVAPDSIRGLTLTWLEAVALDRSTPYRGIAVVERATAEALAGHGVGVYRPVAARSVPRRA